MIEAIKSYIRLLESPPPDFDDRLAALAACLDTLAYEMHRLPEGDVVSNAKDRPDPGINVEYKRFCALAAAAFPKLGMYPLVDSLGSIEQQTMMSNAIDDLADIAHDLMNGLWDWENNSADQGAWTLHFSYRTHWGRHLHALRYYLHEVQYY